MIKQNKQINRIKQNKILFMFFKKIVELSLGQRTWKFNFDLIRLI